MDDADDCVRQTEEVDALRAIFADAIIPENDAGSKFSIVVEPSLVGEQNDICVSLTVSLPEDYPSRSPPTFELSSPHLDGKKKSELSAELQEIYVANLGEPVLFLWIERIRSFLSGLVQNPTENEGRKEIDIAKESNVDINDDLEFISGSIISDRRSHFQAHVVPLTQASRVPNLINKLKQNGKISRATHNVYAYRICRSSKSATTWSQDCEDDGEHHAGSRLLHLLEVSGAKNVLVVVSRWYGGIHLGPDRFKHICNAARELLVEQGFISPGSPSRHKNRTKKCKS